MSEGRGYIVQCDEMYGSDSIADDKVGSAVVLLNFPVLERDLYTKDGHDQLAGRSRPRRRNVERGKGLASSG
jgi:hypothetical protein